MQPNGQVEIHLYGILDWGNMLIKVYTLIEVYILLNWCILNFELLFGQQKYHCNGSNIFFAKGALKILTV